jgi:hypothetical protein
MTSHKAIWSAIAALVTTIVLSLLEVLPSSETLLANDLQLLIENVAALAIMAGVPGIVAFYKRNYRK